MNCKNCGYKLPDDANFCSKCGYHFKENNNDNKSESQNMNQKIEYSTEYLNKPYKRNSTDLIDKIKPYIQNFIQILLQFWGKLDLFSKIVTIMIAVFSIFMIVSLFSGKYLAIFITISQLIAVIIALLIHRNILKVNKSPKKIKVLILIISALFTFLNVLILNNNPDNNEYINNVTKSNSLQKLKPPFNYDECLNNDYLHIIDAFTNAGFANIQANPIEDLSYPNQEQLNMIESISIDQNSSFTTTDKFNSDSNILINYHTYKKNPCKLKVNFIPNIFFSTYDVEINVDSESYGIIPHGEDKTIEIDLAPGEHTIKFNDTESYTVYNETTIELKGKATINLTIACHSDNIDVTIDSIEDLGAVNKNQVLITTEMLDNLHTNYDITQKAFIDAGFTNIKLTPQYDSSINDENFNQTVNILINGNSDYKAGDILSNDSEVNIIYHEDQLKDPKELAAKDLWNSLESNFPLMMAKRAIIVSMTNAQAPDVYADDGNSYKKSKFHTYSDINDFYLMLHKDGIWNAKNNTTWHVDDLILYIFKFGTYMKISADVKIVDGNYYVSNVDQYISTSDYFDSEDYIDHLEPSKNTPYLTVTADLIEEDRDMLAAESKINQQSQHEEWINQQFSWWDGRHEALTDLIKENLNDSNSFKHIETTHIDIIDKNCQKEVNNILKQAGISHKVEVGDLFIAETFTAKNAFNATIKSTAYGIAKEFDNSVILIAIE